MIVCIIFVIYGGLVIASIWPISELSIAKAGTLGDSFGVLTSLFTGLGFACLLGTIFLQREEMKKNQEALLLQGKTFQRQRFEDAFYKMLSLYKENLRELSVKSQDDEQHRISGIDALNYLILKLDKAWKKHKLNSFPTDESDQKIFIYTLITTIESVFMRQTRYVETLSSILILVEEECKDSSQKEMYWRLLASQLTAYEIKYLFYEALIAPNFQPLRTVMCNSQIFQDRLSTININQTHIKSFETIWKMTLPTKKNPIPIRSLLSLTRKEIQAIRKKLKQKGEQEIKNAESKD